MNNEPFKAFFFEEVLHRTAAVTKMVMCGISMSDLECSLEITGLFLREHAGVRENHFRESILKLVQR
jgi:hypothetical protein